MQLLCFVNCGFYRCSFLDDVILLALCNERVDHASVEPSSFCIVENA